MLISWLLLQGNSEGHSRTSRRPFVEAIKSDRRHSWRPNHPPWEICPLPRTLRHPYLPSEHRSSEERRAKRSGTFSCTWRTYRKRNRLASILSTFFCRQKNPEFQRVVAIDAFVLARGVGPPRTRSHPWPTARPRHPHKLRVGQGSSRPIPPNPEMRDIMALRPRPRDSPPYCVRPH